MSNQQDYDDPFAQFDDLDGLDESYPDLDGDLEKGESLPDEIPGDDEFDTPSEEPVATAPSSAPAQASAPSQVSKPFLKTPIGMVSAGLAVVAVGVVGVVGYTSMTSSDEVSFAEPLAPEPIAPLAEPDFSTSPVAGAPIDTTPRSPLQLELKGNPVQEAPSQNVQAIQAPSVPAVQSDFLDTSSSQADVMAQVLEAINSQREDLKDVKRVIEGIANDVETLKDHSNRVSLAQDEMKKDLDSIRKKLKENDKVAESAAKPAPEAVKQVTDVPAATAENALATGRTRIGDFQVIDASASGEMAIIKKVSSGRVFTVFKGEVLIIGGNRLTVSSIEDKGSLVLVGDKLYIDKILAPKTVVKRAPAKEVRQAKRSTKEAKPTVKDAKNFTLNAVYDSDSSFGVVDSNGNFKSYKVGQTVPELGGGRVKGLDKDGNLRVGEFVIKSIY